jgi:hypothetical protein
VIAERLVDILPRQEFVIRVEFPVISIDSIGVHEGSGFSTAPAVFWYLPLPVSRRLELIFDSQAKGLQRFLSARSGKRWPTPDAEPHVSIGPSVIDVWWGGSSETDAAIRLRPIKRDELIRL